MSASSTFSGKLAEPTVTWPFFGPGTSGLPLVQAVAARAAAAEKATAATSAAGCGCLAHGASLGRPAPLAVELSR